MLLDNQLDLSLDKSEHLEALKKATQEDTQQCQHDSILCGFEEYWNRIGLIHKFFFYFQQVLSLPLNLRIPTRGVVATYAM